MIFLCGIPSEPSLGLVIEALAERGDEHVVFNQRRFAGLELELELAAEGIRGELRIDGRGHRLEDFGAVYTRLMDYRLLPELAGQPDDSVPVRACRNLHAALMQWHDLAAGRVLNRSAETGACYSKPLQGQVIRRHGFAVPETLVTNDPDEVRAFQDRHGRVVYKSSSYVRSVVRLLDDGDLQRLQLVRACPVLFQQYVAGRNLRVHTVGGRVFATAIVSGAVDYRYAHLEGEEESLSATTVDDAVAEKCLALAAAFGLEFAGIDIKEAEDGALYCLEVNPSPAFGYYQLHTGQPIARAVAAYLAGEGAS